jgi:thiamine kinase-like enzyme
MAELHSQIGKIDAPHLPDYTDYLSYEITRSQYLSDGIKEKALTQIDELDKGMTCLIHGDIHVFNILFDGDKHYIIDWNGSSKGDPAADGCMTYFYEYRYNKKYAEYYLYCFCEASQIPRENVLKWLPVIMPVQVNIKTEDERNYILSCIDEWYRL